MDSNASAGGAHHTKSSYEKTFVEDKLKNFINAAIVADNKRVVKNKDTFKKPEIDEKDDYDDSMRQNTNLSRLSGLGKVVPQNNPPAATKSNNNGRR